MNGKLLAWIVCFAWLFLLVIVFLFRPMLEDFNLWSCIGGNGDARLGISRE